MIIQYASDLHLEFPQNANFLKAHPLAPVGDVLVLAGDIVPFAIMSDYSEFFDYLSDNFHTTYWIPGNHEYYQYDIANKSGTLHEAMRSNVFLVNNLTLMHENVRFLFSTLWSNISIAHRWKIENELNDFKLIRYQGNRFSSENYNQLHKDSFAFLRSALEESGDQITIVSTHHVPTFFNYPEKYKADILNEAFAVELYDLIKSHGPDYWIYGHHHFNQSDFNIGKTQLLTNQLGYVKFNENKDFNPNCKICV